MAQVIELPASFPRESIPAKKDVVALARANEWKKLNAVPVCIDPQGRTVARFGDDKWNIRPYISQSKTYKSSFNFSAFSSSSSSTLSLELKLIVYGWLFHKSGHSATPTKPSTLIGRFSNLKTVYQFLLDNNFDSLSALSDTQVWIHFEEALKKQDYAQGHLEPIFVAINAVHPLQGWLGVKFGLDTIAPTKLSCKLSNKLKQQTLTIPERIADEIYGKAIELVESAHPYRDVLANTEQLLQENYLLGKKAIDTKIELGNWHWLTRDNGEIINRQTYSQEIIKAQPQTQASIIQTQFQNLSLQSGVSNGIDFQRYIGQLITACYICCGAFSGMRDSELSELTPHSYYLEQFDGRDFHMLQSRTFKLGEKRETWVAAPIAMKAIELASALTQKWREELANTSSGEATDVIWINRIRRTKPPILIGNWLQRLQRFVRHFNITVTEGDYQECMESNPNSIRKVQEVVTVGKVWPIAPHQFRRSLAFYTIKHRLGTSVSLKQQYKHLYLQMTEWYTEGGTLARQKALQVDSQLQELLDTAKDEETANKFFNMVHSDRPLSGSHGKAIVAMRNHIPHIYSSWDVIYQAVKNKTLTLHGTLHSYCKNGYNCDMDGVANPAFCVDCKSGSSIIDENNAKWWQNKHLQLTTYLTAENDVSPSEYSHCITQVRAAELIMKDFGMTFTPYEPPIKVIEL